MKNRDRLDPLVVTGRFNVTTADEKTVSNLRCCAWEINNDHVTSFEPIH